MKEGAHRELDLTFGSKPAVLGDDGAHDLELLGEDAVDVRSAEAAAFSHQRRDGRAGPVGQRDLAFPHLFSEPREVEPHLQIAQVLGRERLAVATLLVERAIAGVGKDLVVRVGLEERAENRFLLRLVQPLRGDPRQLPGGIRHASLDVFFELEQEARAEVERQPKAGMLAHDVRHREVVPDGVQPDPRHSRAAGGRRQPVAVPRLMLMPDDGHVDHVSVCGG